MAAKTTNATVNYDDKRLTEVKANEKEALTEIENTYGGMAEEAEKYYQAQIEASKQWEAQQRELQNQQTELAISQINQQKEQTTKDYNREQSGAYVDWQKQSNAYGVNAEQQASAGMQNTGYSESSQVSMYNTYQNRVATARESYNIAIQNYNNSIAQARIQNSIALAEISYQALQTQLELSLEGFQYKNQLVLDKMDKKTEAQNTYHNYYQDVLNQINTENAMAEQIRQYNQDYALKEKEYKEGIRQFNEEIKRLKEQDKKANELEIKKLELQKKQLEEEKRQFNESLKASKASSSGGGGSSRSYSSGGSSGGSKSSGGNNTPKIKKDNTPKSSTKTIKTSYYSGSINPDVARYGAFAGTKDSNGVAYQPKGISGYGTVSKTGQKVFVDTKTKSGTKKTVVQNVWKTSDGTKWYWEGRENKYKKL